MSFASDTKIIIDSLIEFHEESVSQSGNVTNLIPMKNLIENLKLSSFLSDGGLTGEKLTLLVWLTPIFEIPLFNLWRNFFFRIE